MKPLHHHRESGFSLIVCLIILTLLSILVVSFITTTTTERTTSKAYLNKATAELAANTAVNQAISLLSEQLVQYPDSATVWDSIVPPKGTKPADDLPVEGTYLYSTEGPNFTPVPAGSTPKPARILPLFSRSKDGEAITVDSPITEKTTKALGIEAWTETTAVNLNRARDDKDSGGWIGSPPVASSPAPGPTPTPTPKPFRAKWIEIKDSAATTSGTPAPGAPTPRVIGRYAYWMEDESFKVNLNLLRSEKRGSELDVKSQPTATPTVKGELTRDSEILAQAFYKTNTDRASDCPAWHTPIQGLLRSTAGPSPTDEVVLTSLSTSAFNLRDEFFGKKLFEMRAFNRADPKATATPVDSTAYLMGDKTKFLATIFSGGLNLSRQGSQRLNLNGLGFDQSLRASSLTPSDEEKENNKQIQRLVEAIKFHAPRFGQRFYRTSTMTDANTLNAEQVMPLKAGDPPHQTTYLYKLAANIRDYIDTDAQPTMISNTGDLARREFLPNTLAMSAHEGDNDYWAQGKDSAPFLQEAVVRFRSQCSGNTYTLKVDYYIEFWNMTGEDVYAKETPGQRHLSNAFVKIADPVGWFGHGGGTPPLTDVSGNPPSFGREVTINLVNGVYRAEPSAPRNLNPAVPEGVVFKAGTCTVITTDPDDLIQLAAGSAAGSCYSTGGLNKPVTYYCSNIVGKREFTGPIRVPATNTAVDGIWPQFRDAPDSSSRNQEDYGTEVILANSLGYLDSHPYTISKGGGPNVTYISAGTPANPQKTSRDDTYGGTLFGNGNSPSQLGDPRTNNEQMSFKRWRLGGISEPDQTRYFNPTVSDDNRFSLGWPNSRYVFPARTVQRNASGTKKVAYQWKDHYKVWDQTLTNEGVSVANPDWKTAPAFVANQNLKSIGQLGDIFDPARLPGNGSVPANGILITGSRGGGRTLRVGQPDTDTVKADYTLSDLSQQWASWRLADFLSVSNDLYLPGLININGLRRDNGAALRAACYGMTLKALYCPTPNSNTTGQDTSSPTQKDQVDFNSEEINAGPGLKKLIDEAINTRLAQTDINKPNYFRERGEISELKVLNSKATDLLVGVKMDDAFDRSREELVRRLIEMTTTRGNIFSVYAVGQSINQGRDGVKRVTGEHWVKTTFALLPRKADGSDFRVTTENFDPTTADGRNQRFAKPDHYDVQILQVAAP